MYFDGNNNLSSCVQPNIDSLLKGYLPADGLWSDALLVYEHTQGARPTLYKYAKDRDGHVVRTLVAVYDPETVSTDPLTMKRVIADARMAYPAKEYGLVLWSHGSGWLPEFYHGSPTDMSDIKDYIEPGSDSFNVKSNDSKSFGMDNNDSEMDIMALSNVLDNDYEFIIFDCCLMSCVEVAYELRNNTKYIIASPAEIMTKGFPYSRIMSPIFEGKERVMALQTVCYDYYDYYNSDRSEPWGTIALIDCSQLEPLARVCKNIFFNHQGEISSINPKFVQQYDRNTRCWFNDMDDFVSRIASGNEYEDFLNALNNVVIDKYATEKFISIPIRHYSGISIYIPNLNYTNLNDYYRTLSWNRATGLLQ